MDIVADFKSSVRQRIYEDIDDNISNDSFESYLEDYINDEVETASNSLTEVTNNECERYQKQIEDIIKKNRKNMDEIFEKLSDDSIMQQFDIDLKIDIVNYNTKDSLLKKQIEKISNNNLKIYYFQWASIQKMK